jgi:hypothetical protein
VLDRLRTFYQPQFDLAAWHNVLRAAADSNAALASFDGDEVPNGQFGSGVEPDAYALLACDGSQILPNRHAPVLYGLIQAATVCIGYGVDANAKPACGAAQMRREKIWSEPELHDEDGLISPSVLMNERDVLEISLLAEACANLAARGIRCIALVDGSIVPFALVAGRGSPAAQNQLAKPVIAALDTLRKSKATIAGYIDRPGSATLAAAIATGMGIKLNGVRAMDLDVVAPALEPGLRSAMFDPGWRNKGIDALTSAGHAMRACYINLGATGRPYVARIELPVWCADEIGVVMAVAMRQSQASVGDPYPFILKAAHESAVVTKEDQAEIDAMMQRELLRLHVNVHASAKQSAKDLR